MKNIGIVFVKMGQYNDAINTYEHIMSDNPDIETGIYLCRFYLRFFILHSYVLLIILVCKQFLWYINIYLADHCAIHDYVNTTLN